MISEKNGEATHRPLTPLDPHGTQDPSLLARADQAKDGTMTGAPWILVHACCSLFLLFFFFFSCSLLPHFLSPLPPHFPPEIAE